MCDKSTTLFMIKKLPPLNALKAFEAAGRHKNFSKAGEELNVSHTSISRHIRGLEERLGVHLFSRVSKGVEISPAGEKYLKEVSAAFNQISEATEDVAGGGDDRIRISCESTFALKWLMPNLGKFSSQHPKVELAIEATHSLANLDRHECDVAIRFCRTLPQGVESDLISSAPVFPVGSPKILKGKKSKMSPAELMDVNLIVENHGDLWNRWFEVAGIPNAERPTKRGRLASMLAIEAAIAGQGVALVSMELVHRDLEEGRLIKLSDISLTYGDYRLLYLKQTMRSKSAQAFRDWLLEESADLRQ